MATHAADRTWIKKDQKAQGVLQTAAHKGDLIHDGPYLSIRQLHLENWPHIPPEGQGRYFLVTFKNPVHAEKVKDQLMQVFEEKHETP